MIVCGDVAVIAGGYPRVEVELIVESKLVDIVSAGCDAGVRYGSALQQGMISIPIGPDQARRCASVPELSTTAKGGCALWSALEGDGQLHSDS